MTPSDLSNWRKNERTRLLREREALAPEALAELRSRIDHHLERAFPDLVHGILAFCWPYRQEYDARHLAAALRRRGARTALPAVVAPRAPLVFREWKPGVELADGPLGIPYPVGSPEVSPDHVLLPMLGWDADGYRRARVLLRASATDRRACRGGGRGVSAGEVGLAGGWGGGGSGGACR